MLRTLAILVLLLVAAGVFLWQSLMPPSPLEVPPQGVTFESVTVVQPGEGRFAGQRIVVEGGQIAEMSPATGTDAYAGLYALPGLIDMHVHFPPDTGLRQTEIFAFLFLLHGVTTVRDAADADGTSSAPAREGVRAGSFPGPRSFACGPLVDGDAPLWPNSLRVMDAAAANAAIDELAAAGFDCVKVYNSLPAEALAGVREAAARHGMPVIGHVPIATSFAEARLDDAQHLIGVARPKGDARPYPKVLDSWRTFGPERGAAMIAASLRHGIAHTPTFVTLERGYSYRDYASLYESADAKLLPPFYRDVVWSPDEGMPMLRNQTDERHRLMEDAYLAGTQWVGEAHRAGVTIHAGTDTQIAYIVPGGGLHREIRILSDAAGLGPDAALAAATTVPGRSLGLEKLGRIEPGAPADLVLFREDPTRSVAGLDTIAGVVADGRFYPRAALDAQMERYQDYYASPVFDRVSKMLVRRVMAQIFENREEE